MADLKNYWKQFAEWDTGSRHNLFRRARLKLTGLYLGIIAVILIVFSLLLYYSVAKNIRDNFEGNFSDERTQELVLSKSSDQLQTNIVVIDLLVLLVSSSLSYFLAGRTLRPIQQAVEKQKQFTADASHELRTPLAVMQTNLEVALREKDWSDERGRALIAGAIDEVKLMAALTEDLLALSKLEGGAPAHSYAKINAAELVDRVAKKMQNMAEERKVRLLVEPAGAAFIYGEAGALERLLMNIVSNALNFTSAGGAVSVACSQRAGKVVISIKDSGAGIAKDDLPRVFERFYRADKARGQGGGAGLGLAIAREIAQKHRGTIDISSESGKGTLVTIAFPAVS